jgi:rod shape-determining protein MreC
VKIKRSLTFLLVVLYVSIIFFSPPQYINRPKFLFLKIARLPLTFTRNLFKEIAFITRSKDMFDENRLLHETVSALTRQLAYYKDVEKENERLRSMLEFRQRSPFSLIAASVIAGDSSNFSNTIIIDQGSMSGIKKDTVVISQAGLVGRVIDSSSDISRISLIIDPNSRISAITSRSRQIGVVYGTPSGSCSMRYIPLDADIQEGDEVLTSGFSDVYPKGIMIGKVYKIVKEPRGLSLSALVQPAVDFTRLEEVLCIETP